MNGLVSMFSLKHLIFGPVEHLEQEEFFKPFLHKANEAIRSGELPTAIAFLNRAIQMAPNRLELFVKRAQVLQYGLYDYSSALKDYRLVLNRLERKPCFEIESACKRGIKDMMEQEMSVAG